MKHSKWDQRIRRAEELAMTHPFASEVLLFYKHLAGLQKAIYLGVEQAHGGNHRNSTASLLGCQLDTDLLMPKFHEFLSKLEVGRSKPHCAVGQGPELSAPWPMSGFAHLRLGKCARLPACIGRHRVPAGLALSAAVRREPCGPQATQPSTRDAGVLSFLPRETTGWRAPTRGRRSQTVSDLLAVLNRMGIRTNCLPRMWRRSHRQARDLHGESLQPRASRSVRYLWPLHQDFRPYQERTCGAGG